MASTFAHYGHFFDDIRINFFARPKDGHSRVHDRLRRPDQVSVRLVKNTKFPQYVSFLKWKYQ